MFFCRLSNSALTLAGIFARRPVVKAWMARWQHTAGDSPLYLRTTPCFSSMAAQKWLSAHALGGTTLKRILCFFVASETLIPAS